MPASNLGNLITQSIGFTAAGTITKERFMTSSALQAGLGEKALGSAMYDALITEGCTAKLGIVKIYGGATLAIGDKVTSDANGKAIAYLEDTRLLNKAADEAKISTTTYANDTVLKDIAARISKVYRIFGRLVVKNFNTTAAQTLKYKFVLPAGATMVGNLKESNTIADTMDQVNEDQDFTAEMTLAIGTASGQTSETGVIEFDAVLTMLTTAGNVDLSWAPNANVAFNLTMMGESYINIVAMSPEGMNGIAHTAGTDGNIMQIQTSL